MFALIFGIIIGAAFTAYKLHRPTNELRVRMEEEVTARAEELLTQGFTEGYRVGYDHGQHGVTKARPQGILPAA